MKIKRKEVFQTTMKDLVPGDVFTLSKSYYLKTSGDVGTNKKAVNLETGVEDMFDYIIHVTKIELEANEI